MEQSLSGTQLWTKKPFKMGIFRVLVGVVYGKMARTNLKKTVEFTKVILLRGEDIILGRRYEFRELRHLHRWNENVNNVALGRLDGLKLRKPFYPKFPFPKPMSSPLNYPA